MSQDPTVLQVTMLRPQAVTHSDHAKLPEKIVCGTDTGWKRETGKGRGSHLG